MLNPINFIVIPFKDNPIVKATQQKIDYQGCRDAFDIGGFACAFAPKLNIEECYDNNLKHFHDCLK